MGLSSPTTSHSSTCHGCAAEVPYVRLTGFAAPPGRTSFTHTHNRFEYDSIVLQLSLGLRCSAPLNDERWSAPLLCRRCRWTGCGGGPKRFSRCMTKSGAIHTDGDSSQTDCIALRAWELTLTWPRRCWRRFCGRALPKQRPMIQKAVTLCCRLYLSTIAHPNL